MRDHICTRHPLLRVSSGRGLLAVLTPIVLACADPLPVERAAGPVGTPPTSIPEPSPQVAEIFVADADGTVRGRLTEGTWPSWSPDGRHVVFHRDREIRIIDSDGGNERRLAAGLWPTWSPDGSTIAFVDDRAIHVMNADGSSVRRLLAPTLYKSRGDDAAGLAWSPDGTLIAFEIASYDWPGRVALVSVDGARERYLISRSEAEYVDELSPAWAPDGSRIAFWQGNWSSSGIGTIVTHDFASGAMSMVTANVDPSSRPAWSPDGRTIAFSTSGGGPSIMTIPSSGGVPSLLISNGMDPAWSPDGKRIAFVRLRLR